MNTLFTDIQQAKNILGSVLDGNTTIARFNAHVHPVVSKLTAVIGNSVYNSLLAYAHGVGGDANRDMLLSYCRAVLAFFAASQAAKLTAQVGNMGSIIIVNQNAEPATDAQIQLQSTALAANGYAMREQLLNFLYDNQATQTDAYNAAFDQSLFLWSARQLNAVQSSSIEENDFIRLRDLLRAEENNIVKGTVGKTLFATLKTELKAQSFTGTNAELYNNHILPYLACKAMQYHYLHQKNNELVSLYKGESALMLEQLRFFMAQPNSPEQLTNDDDQTFGAFGLV